MYMYTSLSMPMSSQYARFLDYMSEVQGRAQSLTEYRDIKNPNYIIINQAQRNDEINSGTYYIFSFADLYANGLVKIFCVQNKVFLAICPLNLKKHRGIVNEYGDNVKIILNPVVEYTSWQSLGMTIKNLIADYLKTININTDFLEQESQQLGIYYSEESINFELYSLPEGSVIFSDSNESPFDFTKQEFNAYKIFNIATASGYYLPSPTDNIGEWLWTWREKATDEVGRTTFFNSTVTPMRFIYKEDANPTDKTINPIINQSNNLIYSLDVINGQFDLTKAHLSASNGTIWTGYINDCLMHKLYVVNNNIEETIIMDDTINYGINNIDSIMIPYYNIKVPHDSELPITINARLC